MTSIDAVYHIPPAAQIYYVDATHGKDANSGRDPFNAWKTIAQVNAAAFAPGTLVLFKRGEVWHDTLIISSSGRTGAPVTYGAYGTGPDPVIAASREIVNWTGPAATTGGVWTSMIGGTDPGLVALGGVAGTRETSLVGLDRVGEWYHDAAGGTLSVYSQGKPDIAYGVRGVEIPDKKLAVSLNSKNNVVLADLQMVHSRDVGVMVGWQARNVTLRNVTVADNVGSGIAVNGTSDTLRIDGSKILRNGDYGIVHYNADNTNQVITNNLIQDNGWRPDNMVSGWNGLIKSGEIARNTILNNGRNGKEGQSHGLYHDKGQAGSTLKIHDNVISGQKNGAGIIAKSSTDIHNNTIVDNGAAGISIGQNLANDVSYRIYGNTIANNNGGLVEHMKGDGSITLELNNNIFHKNGGGKDAGAEITIADGIARNIRNNVICSNSQPYNLPGASWGTIDDNLVYNANGENVGYVNGGLHGWSQWQAQGLDKHGHYGNPLFTNGDAQDFTTKSGSRVSNYLKLSPGATIARK